MNLAPRVAILVLAYTAAAADPPLREPMLSKVRDWHRLEADQALDVLANLRDAEAVESLRRGPDEVAPFLALFLAERRGDAAGRMEALLAEGDAVARRTMQLAEAAGDSALAAEGLALLGRSDPRLRAAVISAVSRTKAPGAEETLLQALQDAEAPAEQAQLLLGLASVATEASSEELIPLLLSSESADVRRLAARALSRIVTPEALLAVTSRLAVEKDPSVSRELHAALGAIGGPAEVARLKSCLAAPKPRVERAWCLEALAACPDIEAARALAGILANEGSDLRREAAMALGSRPEEIARTALLSALEKEQDPNLFRFEAASLGRLGEKRAITLLKIGLEDGNVAFFAAMALVDLGDASGAAVLRVALKDDEWRELALEALGKLRDRASEPAILAAYEKERRIRVRAIALKTLLALKPS